MNEKNYLDGLIIGDEKIIKAIYQYIFPKIQNFVIINQGDCEDAKDLFQEALIVIYKNAIKENFLLSCSFSTYLYAIWKRLWLSVLKKRKYVTDIPENELVEDIYLEKLLDIREKQHLYQQKFALLTKSEQNVLQLFFDGISMLEISEILGTTEAYAKKIKFLAKEKLTILIKQDKIYYEIMFSAA